jgi:uncharacterized membrane protein
MSNSNYLKTGSLFYAITILAIGIIHLINQNFPVGLLPVAVTIPGRAALVYITAFVMIAAGLMLLIGKLKFYGAILACAIWLIFILLLHLPKLLFHLHDPNEWTGTSECLGLLCGALLILQPFLPNYNLAAIARFLYLAVLIVFTALHIIYIQFIAMLIPGWLPGHLFWSYVVMLGFAAAAVSLLLNKQVKLAGLLLALMFGIWVIILHLPRALTQIHHEPEWTSLFVALGMCGVSLLLVGMVQENRNNCYPNH